MASLSIKSGLSFHDFALPSMEVHKWYNPPSMSARRIEVFGYSLAVAACTPTSCALNTAPHLAFLWLSGIIWVNLWYFGTWLDQSPILLLLFPNHFGLFPQPNCCQHCWPRETYASIRPNVQLVRQADQQCCAMMLKVLYQYFYYQSRMSFFAAANET